MNKDKSLHGNKKNIRQVLKVFFIEHVFLFYSTIITVFRTITLFEPVTV